MAKSLANEKPNPNGITYELKPIRFLLSKSSVHILEEIKIVSHQMRLCLY